MDSKKIKLQCCDNVINLNSCLYDTWWWRLCTAVTGWSSSASQWPTVKEHQSEYKIKSKDMNKPRVWQTQCCITTDWDFFFTSQSTCDSYTPLVWFTGKSPHGSWSNAVLQRKARFWCPSSSSSSSSMWIYWIIIWLTFSIPPSSVKWGGGERSRQRKKFSWLTLVNIRFDLSFKTQEETIKETES